MVQNFQVDCTGVENETPGPFAFFLSKTQKVDSSAFLYALEISYDLEFIIDEFIVDGDDNCL